VLEVIAGILAELKDDSSLKTRLRNDTNLLTEVGLDSLQLTELMLRLEEKLAIELDLERFELSVLERADALVAFLDQA
jgi:acyl carrier protein